MDKLQITLIKSFNGRLFKHKCCIKGLGLRRINHTVTIQDTPENRGMIKKISYLIHVEQIEIIHATK